MVTLSASELKTRGVTAIAAALEHDEEAVISIRGKSKYVVLSMDEYNHLRECELESALRESQKELEEGKFHSNGIDAHIQRIT